MTKVHNLWSTGHSMQLLRLDDYQSWALEHSGRRLLIDPWLSDEMSLPGGHWLFGRRRTAPRPITDWLPVDALILTAHFSDHLHKPTLNQLPKDIPVFASKTAARMVKKLGFTQVTALSDGATGTIWPGLTFEAIAPGFPYSHNSLGFVFKADDQRVYFETHMVQFKRALARVGIGVDVLIAPMQSVRLLGVPFVQSPERSVEVARVLQPKVWLPTGNDPEQGHGVLSRFFLFYRGARSAFSALLEKAGLPTRFVDPAPGKRFDF